MNKSKLQDIFLVKLLIWLLSTSSSILDTYRPGEFLYQYPIILPFHTVHGVLKTRILIWVAISLSRAYSWPRDGTWVSCITGTPINNLRYAEDTMLMEESEKKLKSLLMRLEGESEKSSLKLSIQKTKIMALGPISSRQVDSGKRGNSDRLFFLGL